MVSGIGAGTQMNDGRDVLPFGQFAKKLFQLNEGKGFKPFHAGTGGTVGFLVHQHQVLPALFQKGMGQAASNEAIGAGDEECHRVIPL